MPETTELGALFREHAQFIARSLRRLGVPASDVEDTVQEVFVVASRKIDAIEAGSARAFLYGTAMRVASNARRVDRRTQARRAEAPIERAEVEIDRGPTPEELIERRHARAALDAVLETMTVEMRAVFTLFELEELTTSEIASFLGVPAGTVSSRLRRAREHFDEQVRELQARIEREGHTT
ncbi:MAG: sigma-70 family RNA polymerase sigma factor [Myxococcales bacterium]|nr:sigma-70 family RNA polymerase sigma factor [Myxococcales bacterium]